MATMRAVVLKLCVRQAMHDEETVRRFEPMHRVVSVCFRALSRPPRNRGSELRSRSISAKIETSHRLVVCWIRFCSFAEPAYISSETVIFKSTDYLGGLRSPLCAAEKRPWLLCSPRKNERSSCDGLVRPRCPQAW